MAASKASSLPHTWHGWVTSPVGKLIQAAWLIEECNTFRVHFVCELRIAKCSAIRQISKFEARKRAAMGEKAAHSTQQA